MLNNPAARKVSTAVLEPIARLLLKLHVSPDAVTVVGTLITCTAALVFFPSGDFVPGVNVHLGSWVLVGGYKLSNKPGQATDGIILEVGRKW